MLDLNGKSVLVTGGTGSFGKKFIEIVLKKFPAVKRLVIFSRDELKQYEMQAMYPVAQFPMLRFFIGDVRDRDRLTLAFQGVDYVVHAAAMKQVPAAEYNPMECIKTNVFGAENVIRAALDTGVQRVVALSTDKAAAPINLYGATKLCSDKLFAAANNIRGNRDIRFSVVRYGNVIGTRGSVVPFFLAERKKGMLPITHADMTRFNISLEQGVNLVFYAMENAWGGEIFVPKIPSFRIVDLAEAILPGGKVEVVGIRPGEKLHEEMITETDSLNSLEFENHYVILPSTEIWQTEKYLEAFKGKRIENGFRYDSGSNPHFLNVEEIREEIRINVDPNFSPGLS
jgi:UDP-N-acetylglucosamine 4,6-dehydratase/5-epimerase